MDATARYLHTGLRITSVNPVHVRFDVYTGAAYEAQVSPDRFTRGLSGSLIIDTPVALEFIKGFPKLERLQSDISQKELRVLLPGVADLVTRWNND